MVTHEQIKSELYETDIEVLIDLLFDVSGETVSTDLDELLCDRSPSEILRAIEYGDCSANDDYFMIDCLGLLNSFTEEELKDYIISYYGDDIAEFISKYYSKFCTNTTDKNMNL